ncbi:MAG: DUF6268 family outer membrane beta-barrel protein [Altibacter sp.]|nr:DUF6268 family outer membrane beta-barrel protein [Altibacter sp.]
MKKLFLLVVCSLFCMLSLFSQETDLARLEYTFIPQSKSDNSVNRVRAFVNFPIKLGWGNSSYLVPGVEYRNLDLDFEDPVPFSVATLGKFEMFRVSLAYTFKMKNEWRVGLKSGFEIASNFEERTVKNRDIRYTGALYLIKDNTGDEVEKPNRFIIGLQYSTNAGRPFPIPIINYYREFHPKWSYSLGSPKTNIKYNINTKNAIQGFITLDGFFSNIQRDLLVTYPDGSSANADNISMTLIFGGLGYEHLFTKNLLVYVYSGHTFFNEIRLRDTERNNLYKINEENTLYFRGGLKFKI